MNPNRDTDHYPDRQCVASNCTNLLDPHQITEGDWCCSQECNMIRLMDNVREPKRKR